MTTPIAPNTIPNGVQMTVKMLSQGQEAACVVGAKGAGSWGDAAGAAVWRDAWWGAFRSLLPASVTVTGAVVRSLSIPEGQVFELGPPASAAGSNAATAGLQAASLLIKWQTAVGGRSGKGRTFLPGLPANAIAADGRSYVTGYSATVQTQINQYLTHAGMSGAGLTPAVLSFRRQEARVITSGALAPIVGVQRRRMR